MYVQNFQILQTRKVFTSQRLADYLSKERNIPVLSRNEDEFVFIYSDIVQEILENLPNDLREEGFTVE